MIQRLFFFCAMMIGIAGCNEGVVTFSGGDTRVRFINLLSRSDSTEILHNRNVLNPLVRNAVPTAYYTLPAGVEQLLQVRDVKDTNSITRLKTSKSYIFAIDAHYTVIARGSDRTDFLRPLLDTLVSPFSGKCAIRFINTSEAVLSANLKSNGVRLLPKSIESNDYSKYLVQAEPGALTIEAEDTDASAVVATASSNFAAGGVYYIILYDKPRNQGVGLTVIQTTDSN